MKKLQAKARSFFCVMPQPGAVNRTKMKAG
jgi:hypothetical protein